MDLSRIPLNPGSDYRGDGTWPDGAGGAANLTGYSIAAFDVTGDLAGAVAVSFLDAAAGTFRIAITWAAAWDADLRDRVLGSFQIRIAQGTEEHATNALTVVLRTNPEEIAIHKGSDHAGQFIWPDDSNGASLAGQTVEVVNASASLAGAVTVTVLDAATRLVRFGIAGDPAWARGWLGSFQLRRKDTADGANRRTTNVMAVVIL